MPLYEYSCPDCGERFEVLQNLGEGADGLTCPSCGAGGVGRELSTFAGLSASPGGHAAPGAPAGCDSGFS